MSIPRQGILVESQDRVRSQRRHLPCLMNTWQTTLRCAFYCDSRSDEWVYQENASGIQTVSILHSRNRALPSKSAETQRKIFRSPPTPWRGHSHMPIRESPGAETHPAQQTFCFHHFTWNLLPLAILLLPNPHLTLLLGSSLENWNICLIWWKTDINISHLSHKISLSHWYWKACIRNKCRNQSGKDTLTFQIDWCLKCNSKTNLHGYFKNQAWALK